jgi:hypothetical protein
MLDFVQTSYPLDGVISSKVVFFAGGGSYFEINKSALSISFFPKTIQHCRTIAQTLSSNAYLCYQAAELLIPLTDRRAENTRALRATMSGGSATQQIVHVA